MVEQDAGIEEPRYLPLILDALAVIHVIADSRPDGPRAKST
jgi:hypothetical protein